MSVSLRSLRSLVMVVSSTNHLSMVGLTGSANRSRDQSISTSPNAMADPISLAWNSRRDCMRDLQ